MTQDGMNIKESGEDSGPKETRTEQEKEVESSALSLDKPLRLVLLSLKTQPLSEIDGLMYLRTYKIRSPRSRWISMSVYF